MLMLKNINRCFCDQIDNMAENFCLLDYAHTQVTSYFDIDYYKTFVYQGFSSSWWHSGNDIESEGRRLNNSHVES